jgi:hypothetical protein
MRLCVLTGILLLGPCASHGQSRWPVDQFAHQLVPGKPAPAPSCGSVTPVLGPDSLGPLRPGISLAQLLHSCARAYLGWHFEEGIAEPGAAVRLGKVLAFAMFEDTSGAKAHVYRIMTADSSARTSDGFGPGSLVHQMINAWGTPKLGVAECALYASWPKQSHVSWILAFPHTWDCSRLEAFVADSAPAHLPRDLRAGIAIVGK